MFDKRHVQTSTFLKNACDLELVSKELNHLAAILHVYARGFELYEVKKKLLLFFKKKMEILLIIFIVKSLQKEQNSTNLLL